ncbi:MAG: hypothetical protein ACRC0X_09710 [Brevinema sp.]
MKSVLLVVFMLISTSAFTQDGKAFFDQMKGKAIVGKSIEGIDTRFEFSVDGQSVVLKKLKGFNHTFVKMIGDIAIYQGSRGGKTHYEGFQIKGGTVLVATSDQIGGIKLQTNTPEGLAQVFNTNALTFRIQ